MARSALLGEVADFLSGGTPSKAEPRFWGTARDIPWLSAKDMKSLRIRDTEDHVTALGASKGTRYARAGSTLVLTRGMTLLTEVPVCFAERDITFNQDVKALAAKPGVLPEYLFYAALAARRELLAMVDLAGHGTGRLPTDRLEALPVWVPDPAVQRAIVDVVKPLDDKIDLNRRMNETLEAIARSLFKSWFVDFDPVRAKAEGRAPIGMDAATAGMFPDKFEHLDAGDIPAGWAWAPLSDLASTQYGFTASASAAAAGPRFLRITDINKLPWIDWSSVPYCVCQPAELDRYRLRVGDILVSRMADPGKAGIVERDIEAVFASYLVRLAVPSEYRYFAYYFLTSPQYLAYAEAVRSGSAQQNMNAKVIAAVMLARPPAEVAGAFSAAVSSLRSRLAAGVQESETLAELRDTLLPKLLSGELRVRDADQIVERAL